MLEDEIQYLGSRFAPRPNLAPLQHPFLQATEPVTCERQNATAWLDSPFLIPSVVAIVLHIEESGRREGEASTLTFLRSDTQSVTIGRRPGDALCEVSVDLDKALFRCPVVSRRHAKIAFTESGRVRSLIIPILGAAILTHFILGLPCRHKLSSRHSHPQARRYHQQNARARSSYSISGR